MTKMLTTKEVSKILKLGINQTRSLIKNPSFPKIMVGKKWLIPEKALEDWIDRSIYKKYEI